MDKEKLELIKKYGYKNKEDFIKEIKESNNKTFKAILDYMINDSSFDVFYNMFFTYIYSRNKEGRKNTYYLKNEDKIIAEYKSDTKEEAEEEFRMLANLLSRAKDYELKEDEEKIYILDIKNN